MVKILRYNQPGYLRDVESQQIEDIWHWYDISIDRSAVDRQLVPFDSGTIWHASAAWIRALSLDARWCRECFNFRTESPNVISHWRTDTALRDPQGRICAQVYMIRCASLEGSPWVAMATLLDTEHYEAGGRTPAAALAELYKKLNQLISN